jgi:hypothetical protein
MEVTYPKVRMSLGHDLKNQHVLLECNRLHRLNNPAPLKAADSAVKRCKNLYRFFVTLWEADTA